MDSESNESKSSSKKTKSDGILDRHKFNLSAELKLKLKEQYPDVLELINSLQKFVIKQHSKIKKFKSKHEKTKKSKSVQDGCTQTEKIDEFDSVKSLSDDIKEAAEMAMQNTGFVYEKTSGLYYDYNSGYYYNAELGLYYDGNTGTYMKYNNETQTYDFHSQVDISTTASKEVHHQAIHKREHKTRNNTKGLKRKLTTEERDELEEGECSDSSNSVHSVEIMDCDLYEVAAAWPPCMRIIIKSTELSKLKEGSLYIITCQGGTLGREGNHSIIIPDINISKHHLKFNFNKDAGQYTIIDLGSRNGTILNGQRISPSKQESEPVEVTHGSEIQLSSTTLLCHIHTGNETCKECEPGLLQKTEDVLEKTVPSTKSEQHKSELRKLRKKYGVNWNADNSMQLPSGYTDRAHTRRQTVGSHNEHEKTQVASTEESISSENKGFKLLSKMGWSEGQSLGKEGTGVLNPIEVVSTVGTAGIGYAGEHRASIKVKPEKRNIWEKTQKRYKELPSSPVDT